jgi:hypothetical protein
MNRIDMIPLAFLLALLMPRTASAEPAFGGNCLSCHNQLLTDALYIFGEETTADPDEIGTGAPDRGILPVFQACRGGTESLLVEVAGLATDDTYAVQLKRLRFPGVVNNGDLAYTGDCSWPEWGEDANYYSDPEIRHRWGTGPTTFTFDLDVELGSPDDYYDLVFAVAGKFQDGGGLFYAEQHLYLQVSIPGDMDKNGNVDFDDIPSFVDALLGIDPGDLGSADMDCNGSSDGLDIQLFVQALV